MAIYGYTPYFESQEVGVFLKEQDIFNILKQFSYLHSIYFWISVQITNHTHLENQDISHNNTKRHKEPSLSGINKSHPLYKANAWTSPSRLKPHLLLHYPNDNEHSDGLLSSKIITDHNWLGYFKCRKLQVARNILHIMLLVKNTNITIWPLEINKLI